MSKCQRHTEHPVITQGCKDCEIERLLRIELVLKAAAFRGVSAEDALRVLRVYEGAGDISTEIQSAATEEE